MSDIQAQIRNCKHCGADISNKRYDAVYCSTKCKSRDHNILRREERQRTQQTINQLLSNWRILNKLLKADCHHVTSFQLKQLGYDLSIFTGFSMYKNNQQICYKVFDIRLLTTGDKKFKIFQFKS